jgi:hypothetical protein
MHRDHVQEVPRSTSATGETKKTNFITIHNEKKIFMFFKYKATIWTSSCPIKYVKF